MDAGILFVIVLAAIVVLGILMSVRVVPQGYSYTLETFGRYTRTLNPGLNLLIPFTQKIGHRLSVMEQVADVPSQEIITRDNAMVEVDGVIFFQILDVARAAYEVKNLEYAILNLTITNVRSVMGSMDLDELLSNRETINTKLLTILDQATNSWGVKVTRIEIKDITPPRDLINAMARQMKAEREKRASILEAEGKRQSEILKAEGEKQAIILASEGRKEAAFRDAEGRERFAQAEARATEMLSEAIGSGNIHSINYLVAQRYIEALQALASAPNQKVMLMPVEAASMIGSIAGIAEIARDAFNPNGKNTPPSGSGASGGGGGGASSHQGRTSGGNPGAFTAASNGLSETGNISTESQPLSGTFTPPNHSISQPVPRKSGPWG